DPDTEDSELSYSWKLSPNIGSLDGNSGLVDWTVSESENLVIDTPVTITVTVSDGFNEATAAGVVTILVGSPIDELAEEEEIITEQDLAEYDRVHFTKFGDSALNFDVVFYFNSTNYAEYLDAQQEINLALKERFEKEKIEFAYPTQTIYLAK
ncbi:mechanosensitive ion channel, partial [Patescibacteria group bacterium]|nr:mechanosensitive ion channel [Patescibacteria group bacterium]